jgi:hypothetical protein
MVTGDPPFISQDRRKLHLSIRQGRIRFPKFSTAPCNSVLKGLLTRDVDKRLGCSRTSMFKIGGVRALKDHAFFSGLSWDALLAKQMRPPIVPLLAHASDTQYFEPVRHACGGLSSSLSLPAPLALVLFTWFCLRPRDLESPHLPHPWRCGATWGPHSHLSRFCTGASALRGSDGRGILSERSHFSS